MNDYTFMFHVVRGALRAPEPGAPYNQWTLPIKRIYMVRWTSKYTFNSQRKHARTLVARHIEQEVADNPEAAQAMYSARFLGIVAQRHTESYVQRWPGHELGHPQIIRVEQPGSRR
jgi:hypothetical protein